MPAANLFASLRNICLVATVLLPGLAMAAVAASQPTQPPVFSADGLGKGSVALDGPWQFHLGDDPAFALPATNDAIGQSGWVQITAGKGWGEQGHRSYTGYAWYRRHVHVVPAAGAPADFSILIYL
jgi:hypothetical protein